MTSTKTAWVDKTGFAGEIKTKGQSMECCTFQLSEPFNFKARRIQGGLVRCYKTATLDRLMLVQTSPNKPVFKTIHVLAVWDQPANFEQEIWVYLGRSIAGIYSPTITGHSSEVAFRLTLQELGYALSSTPPKTIPLVNQRVIRRVCHGFNR